MLLSFSHSGLWWHETKQNSYVPSFDGHVSLRDTPSPDLLQTIGTELVTMVAMLVQQGKVVSWKNFSGYKVKQWGRQRFNRRESIVWNNAVLLLHKGLWIWSNKYKQFMKYSIWNGLEMKAWSVNSKGVGGGWVGKYWSWLLLTKKWERLLKYGCLLWHPVTCWLPV